MSGSKIGIIGCGRMGKAIAEKLAPDHQIALYDRNQSHIEELAKFSNVTAYKSAEEAIHPSELIILAVKPQDIEALSQKISKDIEGKKLLVSILVGVDSKQLQSYFPNVPILRLMPSIAITTGSTIVGLVKSDVITPQLHELIESIFNKLGPLHWIVESQMDAFSSLIGSGPAFACVVIESITDAAIHMGFKPEEGYQLTLEMLSGLIAMLKETGVHPGEAKWQVTSPGGITIEGIKSLESDNVRAGVINALLAAYNKMQ